MKSRVNRIKDWGTLAAFNGAWRSLGYMPDALTHRIFQTGAQWMNLRHGAGAQQLQRNLARVLDLPPEDPRVKAATKAGLANYARYWREAFTLPQQTKASITEQVVVTEQAAHIHESLTQGRGLVLALPHMGNWDLLGAWAALNIAPVYTIAERLHPPELYEKFVQFRSRLGVHVLPADEGVSTLRTLATQLKAGALVALVADRDLTGTGFPVEFFGHTATFPTGPALLAQQTGAEFRTAYSWYSGSRTFARVSDPIEFEPHVPRRQALQQATEAMARAFEQAIRAYPEHWHMLQPFWQDDRQAAKVTS